MKAGKHIAGNVIEMKKFAKAIVDNGGNATEAVLATGKKITRGSARDRGSRLLKRDDVQAEIQKALEDNGIGYNYVLGTRKKFIEAGIDQLSGKKKVKGSVVTPKDTHSHLQGIESVLARVGESTNSNNNSSKHIHLHLEEKNQKELLTKRQELNSWFSDIIDP